MVGSKASIIRYKFIVYNAKYNLISVPISFGGRMYVETEYAGCYRPMVNGQWEQIGFL